MERLKFLLVGLGSLAVGVVFLLLGVVSAQQAPQYPLDDKLANEPAPWTAPGKWGKRGNWGRWGEEDKRGMLNYITPEMIIKAAGLVKQGKVYALGEELHSDVPRVITPARVGIQVIQEIDGYDGTAAKSGGFDGTEASWHGAGRCSECQVYCRARGVTRCGEVQGPGPASL